jgi:hypothetical protein
MTGLGDLPFEVSDEVRAFIGDRDLDSLTPEDLSPPSPPLEPEEARDQLAALAARIEDGRAATSERAELMGRLGREGWTQGAIAKAAGISQAAVSKALRSTAGSRSLEHCRTAPYLIGRLIGLACHLSGNHQDMSCERLADKIASGGIPVTAVTLARLQGRLSRDLARPGVPEVYRMECAEISARLADLATIPPLPWPTQGQWGVHPGPAPPVTGDQAGPGSVHDAPGQLTASCG